VSRSRYGGMRILILLALVATASIAQSPPITVTAKPDAKAIALGKVSAAYFLGLQELPAFTPEEMALRHEGATGDPEALAADKSLNEWKVCALGSIDHWAELKPGRGEIVDGAMGRCVDIERDYRNHLLKISQDGRMLFDLSFARQMARTLEDTWRPRILAAALDHDLEVVRVEKEREKEKSGGRKRPAPLGEELKPATKTAEPPKS
jgi:hypothetical protein